MYIENAIKNKEVEVGDIVLYDEEVCIVIFEADAFVEDDEQGLAHQKSFPIGEEII